MRYECDDGTEIWTESGNKGELDFKTRCKSPGGRQRTPSHSNYLTDLLIKREHNREVTNSLVSELLYMAENVEQSESNDPDFQFQPDYSTFSELDDFGEFTAEFILVSYELIIIQEKNNYPNGELSVKWLRGFLDGKDNYWLQNIVKY